MGQLGEIKSGIAFPEIEQGGREGVPFYKVSDMTKLGNEREMENANNYVSNEQLKKNKWYPNKDIPAVIFAKVGAALLLNRKRLVRHPFLLDNNTMSYSFNNSWDTQFGFSLFETLSLQKFAQIGALPSFNASDIKTIKINIPDKREQALIGGLFKQLDNSIALHQRKVESLQSIKEGLIQQLFPHTKNGSLSLYYPEYQNIWKSFKLDNIAERVRGNDARMDLPTLTISASRGWLNQEERFSQNIAGKEQKNYTLLEKGMLSYNKGNSKVAPYGIAYKLENYEEALVPRVYHSFAVKENASEDFIEYLFTSRKVDKELAKIITSGARMDGLLNINYQDFSSISILLPQIEEQKRIAKTLKQIDKIIELSNKKIENLKSLKMAYLKKMFI